MMLVSDEPTTVFLPQPNGEPKTVLRIVGEFRFRSTPEERVGE